MIVVVGNLYLYVFKNRSYYFDGLVQERRNSIANAMDLLFQWVSVWKTQLHC